MPRKCSDCGSTDIPVNLQCQDCGSHDVMTWTVGEEKPDGWDEV